MADTLEALEDRAPQVMAQGELSAAEETALRAEAWGCWSLDPVLPQSLIYLPSACGRLLRYPVLG